ncbi:hypothetical protein AL527_02720 [Pseudomonas fulva]|nr:hypothetical protein AL527_02720 [Pseudomonas fulva]
MTSLQRGSKYWDWADHLLPDTKHEESLSDGTMISVMARLSRCRATQVFVGVYSGRGKPLLEEFYDSTPHANPGEGLSWGLNRARTLSSGDHSVSNERPFMPVRLS